MNELVYALTHNCLLAILLCDAARFCHWLGVALDNLGLDGIEALFRNDLLSDLSTEECDRILA